MYKTFFFVIFALSSLACSGKEPSEGDTTWSIIDCKMPLYPDLKMRRITVNECLLQAYDDVDTLKRKLNSLSDEYKILSEENKKLLLRLKQQGHATSSQAAEANTPCPSNKELDGFKTEYSRVTNLLWELAQAVSSTVKMGYLQSPESYLEFVSQTGKTKPTRGRKQKILASWERNQGNHLRDKFLKLRDFLCERLPQLVSPNAKEELADRNLIEALDCKDASDPTPENDKYTKHDPPPTEILTVWNLGRRKRVVFVFQAMGLTKITF